ncbi:MAG: hypothetical protein HN731_04100 [Rhodospirillaceae bacterium]|nr:hypothetical protein [Rhodospirillaceae bacterium]
MGVTKKWLWRFWIIPPVAIGLAAIFLAPMVKNPPQKSKVVERAVSVRTITVKKLKVFPRTIGFGRTQPGRTWQAVTEVAGQIIWVSEKLKNGHFTNAGDELLRVDDASYRLSLAQIEAQLNASHVKDRTTQTSLVIAKKNLALLNADLGRKQTLVSKGSTSKAALETTQRAVLSGEATVQNLINSLAINRAERKVLLTQKAGAELDLSHTVIKAPFNVRLTDVRVNRAQFVNKGQILFLADGMEVAEVAAQFPIGKLRPLIGGNKGLAGLTAGAKVPGALGLEAVFKLHSGTHTVKWKARVDRVSGTIDPQTQTLGVVVAVDKPYLKAAPGKRPPLVRNSFVEVELLGRPMLDQIVIPVSAIHEGKVFVLDSENRLVIRTARIKFSQGGFAVLSSGVKPQERVVVSDLIPAVEGMLLKPKEDMRAKKKLIREATGKDGSK